MIDLDNQLNFYIKWMPRRKKSRKGKKSGRKKKVLKKAEKKEVDTAISPELRRKKKKVFPFFATCICINLLCCMCSGIVGGFYWWFKKRQGGVYSKNPLVSITEPTGSNWYATDQSLIKLAGIASDEADKLSKITWEVEGGDSGTATGTKNWETEEISLEEGDNKIIIKAYDKGRNIGEDTIFIVYNRKIVFIGGPKLSPDYIYKDDPPQDVIVQTTVMSESDKDISYVKLYEVDAKGEMIKEIGEMEDNGEISDGDDIPSDGTYGYKGAFSTSKDDPIYIRVVAKLENSDTSAMSGVVKFVIVESISQEALEQIESLNQQVTDLVNQLQDQGESLEQVANQVNDLLGQQEGIDSNGISQQGQGVWWVYENTCIPGGIALNPPDTRGGEVTEGGSLQVIGRRNLISQIPTHVSAQGNLQEVQNTRAVYLGPYFDEFGDTDDYHGAWGVIKASECPECEMVEKKNQEVTVEDFKTLDQYGLIVISSHGDNWYGGLAGDSMCLEGLQQSQVIIYTGQKLTSENIGNYEVDLMARRLAVGADGSLIILPAFISHYNSLFPNSLVYVATCRSAYNSTMAAAFLGRGASVYYGFDDYVLSSYCYSVGTKLFDSFILQEDDALSSFLDTINAVESSDGTGPDFLWTGSGSLKMGGRGFGNVGFEEGNLIGWTVSGDTNVIPSLGSLEPTEGKFMAIISTGLGSVRDSTSSITQSICYRRGESTLKFDYNIISEEPTEYLNSFYDDRLDVSLVVDGESTQLVSKGVNDSQWNEISGINFAGGDETTYETGWQTFSYSLENVSAEANLKLKFEVSDVGDSAFDTAVLIDNVRIE